MQESMNETKAFAVSLIERVWRTCHRTRKIIKIISTSSKKAIIQECSPTNLLLASERACKYQSKLWSQASTSHHHVQPMRERERQALHLSNHPGGMPICKCIFKSKDSNIRDKYQPTYSQSVIMNEIHPRLKP